MYLTINLITVAFLLFKRQYQLLEALVQLVLIMLIPIPFSFQKKSSRSCLFAVHSSKKWSSFCTEPILQTGHVLLSLEILLCLPFSMARL